MLAKRSALATGFFAVLIGCSSNSSSSGSSPDQTGSTYQEILAQDWQIDPGVETYYCVYKTLTEDLWVSDFQPESPTGTHHVTLGYSDPGPPDGVVSSTDNLACNGTTLGSKLAFGGTRGTDEFHMPDGVAARIPAGQQLLLSVHLFNTTSAPLSGRTGVEAIIADPTKIQHEAEIIFAAPGMLSVPPGPSTQVGTCTLDEDSTLFAVLGHMHLMGKHITSTINSASGGTQTLLDQDYDFNSQKYKMLDPSVSLKQGDQIITTCTYDNTSTNTLTFGESTNLNEMCISITYRYPRGPNPFFCNK